MTLACDLALDLGHLRRLLRAAETEATRATSPVRLVAAEALQFELWRMRRPLVAAAGAHQRQAIEVARPFARVAELLDEAAGGVLLSIRAASGRADFVQLRPADFHRAADFVRSA
jgi:hypothetical protein